MKLRDQVDHKVLKVAFECQSYKGFIPLHIPWVPYDKELSDPIYYGSMVAKGHWSELLDHQLTCAHPSLVCHLDPRRKGSLSVNSWQ